MSDAYDTTNDTREMHDAPEDRPRPHVAIDPLKYAGMPPGGYEQHPLFPREDGSAELRDIQYLSFRRRSTDGTIDNLAEDVPAGEILTWADVVGPWGGGEYKAIGKDKNHRIVAWYPEKNGEWMRFDLESKPFTLREQRSRPTPRAAAPAAPAPVYVPAPPAAYAPPMVAAPPAYNPAPAPHPMEGPIAEMYRAFRSRELAPAPQPPAAPPPPTPHPLEATVAELLRELRVARAPAPAPAPSDAALVEMIKSQGELLRTVLAPRPVEPSRAGVHGFRLRA